MDDDGLNALSLEDVEMVEDIGFEPGVLGPSAATLVDELPAIRWDARCVGHQAGGFEKLRLIPAGGRHGCRDAVRGEGDVGVASKILRKSPQRLDEVVDVRPHEVGVVVEDAELVDLGRMGALSVAGSLDVLSILTAA